MCKCGLNVQTVLGLRLVLLLASSEFILRDRRRADSQLCNCPIPKHNCGLGSRISSGRWLNVGQWLLGDVWMDE